MFVIASFANVGSTAIVAYHLDAFPGVSFVNVTTLLPTITDTAFTADAVVVSFTMHDIVTFVLHANSVVAFTAPSNVAFVNLQSVTVNAATGSADTWKLPRIAKTTSTPSIAALRIIR